MGQSAFGVVSLVAAFAFLFVGVQVVRAGGLQDPPPPPPAGDQQDPGLQQPPAAQEEPPAPPPFSGISQYVEQVPTAYGFADVDQAPTAKRPARKLPPKLKKSIARSGGSDAAALTRLVTPVASVPVAAEQPVAQEPTAQKPSIKPRVKPSPVRVAAVEQTERKALHDDTPSPVSPAALTGAIDPTGGGTGARVLALVVVLVALTVLAALNMRRRRSG